MKYILSFMVFLLCQSVTFAQLVITETDHHQLNTSFSTNALAPMGIGKNSVMYSGTIGKNYLLFKDIKEKVDGRVIYTYGAEPNISDKIELSLVEVDENLTVVKKYKIELRDNEFFIVEETNNIEISMGPFAKGDEFIVERCGAIINYYHQGVLLKYSLLETNDFVMHGLIDVNFATSVEGSAEYKPLNL